MAYDWECGVKRRVGVAEGRRVLAAWSMVRAGLRTVNAEECFSRRDRGIANVEVPRVVL